MGIGSNLFYVYLITVFSGNEVGKGQLAGVSEICTLWKLYQFQLFCSSDGLDAAVDVQFAVDVLGVGFDSI